MTFPSAVFVLREEVLSSLALAAVLFVLTHFASWLVGRDKSMEGKRFWRLTFRHLATACFVLGVGIIWKAELQSVLVALGAATAGILIAFREQWLSLLAFWVRVVKRQYALNDFIEVDGLRGRVLDITWLTTVLAETGCGSDHGFAYTGRVVHVPNNRLLLSPVLVENLTGDYSVHALNVSLPKGANALQADAILLAAANRQCEALFEEAAAHMQSWQTEQSMDAPSVTPRTRLLMGKEGAVTIQLRIVVPFKDRMRYEQSILREFLSQVDEEAWPREHKD